MKSVIVVKEGNVLNVAISFSKDFAVTRYMTLRNGTEVEMYKQVYGKNGARIYYFRKVDHEQN